MTTYYILFCLFSIFESITVGEYEHFRGSSAKVSNFLGNVTGIGTILIIAACICKFFIMPWKMALLLLAGYLILAPVIGLWLRNIPFFGFICSILTIITGILLISVLTALLRV